jgi:hypothetical protein
MADKQLLYKFVDAVINGDQDTASQVLHGFSVMKSQEILGLQSSHADVTEPEPVSEAFLQQLLEFIGEDSPIRLDGDNVLVKGKKVGVIKNDLNDIDSGINFVTVDGTFSKEFDTAEELYKFLMQRYGVKA